MEIKKQGWKYVKAVIMNIFKEVDQLKIETKQFGGMK